jgi:sugar phosphate isomerase/epimerase
MSKESTVAGPYKLSYMVATPEVKTSALAWVGDGDVILPRIAEIGFDGVELQLRDPREFDVGHFTRRLTKVGLGVVGVSIGPAANSEGLYLTSPDETVRAEARARMRLAIECAAEWNCTVALGGVRGRVGWAPSPRVGQSWLDEGIGDAVAYADQLKVRLALEPQSRYVTDTFNSVSAALDYVSTYECDGFGIEADTYHLSLEERSVVGALARAHASGKLFHVQVADSNRQAPGWGHLNWIDIVSVLRHSGYLGWLGVETSQSPDSEQSAVQSYRYIRAVDQVAAGG